MDTSLLEVTSRDRTRVLAIMAKAPRAGHVKTRLASVYSPTQIIQLYRALIEDTIELGRLAGACVVVVCPASDAEELSPWMPPDVRVIAQRGHGLADGLSSAFELLCESPRRVIALNGDSPHLPPAVLDSAFSALVNHDLVIGPCDDGGYYLVGATAPHAGLFDSRAMGTGSAFDALTGRARVLGLSAALIDEHYDVDLPEDLALLDRDLQERPDRAPRTAALLATWSTLPEPG